MIEAQNLLTVEMAAQYLHCHPETVRRMIRRGDLKAVKFRKFWRVPMEGLRRVEHAALDAPASTPVTSDRQTTGARLAALESIGVYARKLPDHRAEAGLPPLDLSGERAEVYGYSEREDAQL